MSSNIFNLIKLQLKLWSKGDRMLFFYIGCLALIVIFYLLSYTFFWQILIVLSNIYLAILYIKDGNLAVFYRIVNVSLFEIHLAKVISIYCLSLLQLPIFILLNEEKINPTKIIAHFLAFYTILLFYNFPNWVKSLSFLFIFILFNITLPITNLYLSIFITLTLNTLVLKNIKNEFK